MFISLHSFDFGRITTYLESVQIFYAELFLSISIAVLFTPTYILADTERRDTLEHSAQSLPEKDEFKTMMERTMRFHADWKKYRTPLSELKQENVYHKSLVIDDMTNRINERFAKLNSVDDKSDLSFLLKANALIKRYEEKHEFYLILKSSRTPVIGHVDCETDYQCMCFPMQVYSGMHIDNVPLVFPDRKGNAVEIVNQMKEMPEGRFYDCYSVVNHHEGFQRQSRCRFLSRLVANSDKAALEYIIGSTRIPELKMGDVKELVVESAVRVKPNDKFPLEGASTYVRPIYALIGDAYYVFQETFFDPGVRCALIKIFDAPVFEFSGCADKASCAKTALEYLIPEIDTAMANQPIEAALDRSDPFLPGERIYSRNYQPSHVLGGAFYESSQYIMQWYRNSIGEIGPPGEYAYSLGYIDHSGDYIFVKIRQSLSVRTGRNGAYPEASRQHYVAYEEAVSSALRWAVDKACSKFQSATLDGGTCKIGGENP